MKKKVEHYQGFFITNAAVIYGEECHENGNGQERTLRIEAQQPILVRQEGDTAVIIISGAYELDEFKRLIAKL